ncbi:maestro heat like repeat family member 9 [Phyllostomus discolor]|uniref:Maestro heat like repeat family member 9 n=1 Tax=Phyllostomus discolor TaxID=89673 RepID=A0A833YCG0_9CHIR|nr:maestro heat like repeat family member 9 [Phyllostomus discolor]
MTTRNHKTSKNSRDSKDIVTDLQSLQSSVKWQHLEHKADSLWDAYTSVISDQALILSINSSFVDPLLQFETQLKIIESSFKSVFTIPCLEEVKEMGNGNDDEDLQELYQSILNVYEDTLLILVSKDFYKLQILKEMIVWMSRDKLGQQGRILVIISRVLIFAAKKVKESASVDAPCLGVLAAELCLLCSHASRSITQPASMGMYHLLCIAKRQNEDIVRNTTARYEQSGSQCHLSHCCDIEFLLDVLKEDKTEVARSIGHMLLPSLLTDFVWSLLMRLAMPDRGMTKEAANMLRLTLEYHAHKVTMASQALCTLLPVPSYKKAVAQFFPQLLMALLFQVFYTCNMTLVIEKKLFFARDALRVLLYCSGLQEVDTALNRKNFWDQISQVLFHHHGVYLIATTLGEHNFPQFPETLHYLYKLSVEGPRRSEDSVITVIFLTELLNKFFKDPFPEEFLALFRKWINDSNPTVSKLSLQKIASMAPVINQVGNVCSLLLSILDAFLSKDQTVIIRALLTLRRLLNKLDKVTYSSLCTQIASSYCPLMDHSNGGIRSMAIRHFGELVRDMSQYRWMLNNAVFRALVPLILFLEDTETRVITACKHTLAICVSELRWPISNLLLDRCYSFELAVLSICNNLFISHGRYIVELLSDALGFLRNSQVYLRRASVILIGYLTTLGGHLLLRDDIEVILEGIDRVLDDEDPEIKALASKTHKLLKNVANKLTSSVIKQTSRRLFNFIYIKKFKPLYNYISPNDVTKKPCGDERNQEREDRPCA